jgi:hypothetical protein
MKAPNHLEHKPITAVEDYSQCDGKYKGRTDAQVLSIGKAQYDLSEISAKVFRHAGGKWSRQSEELPLHRVVDLCTAILKSILLSANIPFPQTSLKTEVVEKSDLCLILGYYKDLTNKKELLPKLQELQIILNYFMNEEPKL